MLQVPVPRGYRYTNHSDLEAPLQESRSTMASDCEDGSSTSSILEMYNDPLDDSFSSISILTGMSKTSYVDVDAVVRRMEEGKSIIDHDDHDDNDQMLLYDASYQSDDDTAFSTLNHSNENARMVIASSPTTIADPMVQELQVKQPEPSSTAAVTESKETVNEDDKEEKEQGNHPYLLNLLMGLLCLVLAILVAVIGYVTVTTFLG